MAGLLRNLALLGCALVLGGCLEGGHGKSNASSPGRGRALTIYSSLPTKGASAPAARSVATGERAALSDARGRAGAYRIRLVQLGSADSDGRPWDPALVDENAKRARDDPSAMAYVGELGYGASAVSVPITNQGGILQLSPGDGLTSLTRAAPGDLHGGPERYYPSGRRTFLRLVPTDLDQAEALLELARKAGSERLALVRGRDIASEELAHELAVLAPRKRLRLVADEDLEDEPAETAKLVSGLAAKRPESILLVGVTAAATRSFLTAARARMPGVEVLGSSGLLPSGPAERLPGARRVMALSPVRPVAAYPASARRLLRRLGSAGARAEALYGYEAMRVVLDAVRRGGADRVRVVRAALARGVRRSVIGSYVVLSGGDVSGQRLAVYREVGGRLAFERLIR